ncbi:hypothetical protein [Endobacterium cereale]|nr:hypothetical protein [Endobacterium cereale]MEB2845419.1 hypothetical protein [Endobacterium cereale]
MKPWIVMGILATAVLTARWFLWAYPSVTEASAHIGSLMVRFATG